MRNYQLFYAWMMIISGSIGFFLWGYLNSISNTLIPYMRKHIFPEKSASQISLIASAISIGAAIGTYIGHPLANRFGRRGALMLGDALCAIGICFTIIENFELIILGRFLGGIVIGLNSSIGTVYLIEMAPKEIRGIAGTINMFLLNIGICLAYAVGLFLPKENHFEGKDNVWKIAYGLTFLPLIVRLFIFIRYLPFDTPPYLISKYKEQEAREALETYLLSGVEETMKELIKDREIQNSNKEDLKLRDLILPKYRNALLMGIIIIIALQFTGLNPMMVFPNVIFGAGMDDSQLHIIIYVSLSMSIINTFSKLLATYVVQKYGRRSALTYGLFITALEMFIYSLIVLIDTPANIFAKTLLVFWPISFSISVGGIGLLYISEILPPLGVTLCVELLWISGFVILQPFLTVVENIGLGAIFMIFSLVSFAGSAYFYLYALETKGKPKNQIILQYMNNGPFHAYQMTDKPNVEMRELFLASSDRT